MNGILKVEDVKRPLRKGEKYLVPCIVRRHGERLFITPVINHPHNDKENGQEDVHYHADFRFVKHEGDPSLFPTVVNKHSRHYFVEYLRPKSPLNGEIEYFILPVINEDFSYITPVNLISKSKLKHKCIYKGKCPHRGYDLSQVKKSMDGSITCPLHGLKFDSISGQILNPPTL